MSARALRLLADTASRRHAARVEYGSVAGLPALVAGEGPAFVFANACTPRGLEEPALAAFLGSVAAAGFHAVAPELPDVRGGVVTPETVDALVRVAEESDGSLVLAGASTGGALAILAAADARLARRVERVSAIGPYADLANVLRLVTTGCYADEHGDLHAFPIEPRLRWAVERSLGAIAGDAADPLLENAHPVRFDELLASLRPETLAALDALSPVHALVRVEAPVDVAFDPSDRFFPPAEARALERAGARLTLTPALGHVRPRFGLGLPCLVRFADRMLVARPALAS
jgi:hypothetical protein